MNPGEVGTTVVDNGVSLSPPWDTHFKKIWNLFNGDPEVDVDDELVETEQGTYEFTIHCVNPVKLAAIKQVVKAELIMGNVKLKVNFELTDPNDGHDVDGIGTAVIEAAFKGNPNFDRCELVKIPFSNNSRGYAVFKKGIIQFYNDDLTDIYGNYSDIIANVATDIRDDKNKLTQNVSFCTDVEE